jgi:cation transport protein ChaC
MPGEFGGTILDLFNRSRNARLDPISFGLCIVSPKSPPEPNPGPNPEWTPITDDDQERPAQSLLAGCDNSEVCIFGYASLIWKPEFDVDRASRTTENGWHREFCIEQTRWRGTPALPGLMLALQPGGYCEGVALYPNPDEAQTVIRNLVKREITDHESIDMARWIELTVGEEQLNATVFWAGPKGRGISSGLPLASVVHRLAHACGHFGSSAEYLFNTVSHLESLGIEDENLWEIQALAAREILTWDTPEKS